MHVMCPTHSIFLDLIILITYGEIVSFLLVGK
jgi:hypothetical protein